MIAMVTVIKNQCFFCRTCRNEKKKKKERGLINTSKVVHGWIFLLKRARRRPRFKRCGTRAPEGQPPRRMSAPPRHRSPSRYGRHVMFGDKISFRIRTRGQSRKTSEARNEAARKKKFHYRKVHKSILHKNNKPIT